jgi:hypothetical protein
MKRMILVLTVVVLVVTLASSAFAQVQQIAENTGDVCTTPDACNQMNIGGADTGPQINSITSGNSNISGQDSCSWYYYEDPNLKPWWEYWCWWPSSGWEYVGWSY